MELIESDAIGVGVWIRVEYVYEQGKKMPRAFRRRRSNQWVEGRVTEISNNLMNMCDLKFSLDVKYSGWKARVFDYEVGRGILKCPRRLYKLSEEEAMMRAL